MAANEGGVIWEQTIEDPVTGLTFEFEFRDNGSTKLRIRGGTGSDDQCELIFDENGHAAY